MTRARFITLEGIEGVGKTTHMKYIAGLFRKNGHEVVLTREPGGTRLGESVREVLLHGTELQISAASELLLIFTARSQHLHELILPGLAAGKTILCDRFTDATYAYQGGGRGIASSQIKILEDYVQQGLKPDLTLLFDAPVETGLRRACKRSTADRFESETVAFFQRVRQSYLDLAAEEPERMKVIDADRTIEDVEAGVRRILEGYL